MPSRHKSACHVIVCGNEKGGTGKTTTAAHTAVGLLQLGFNVATLDLDLRQQSLTRFIDYRDRYVQDTGDSLISPAHYNVIDSFDHYEAGGLDLEGLKKDHDFIVIDTPGAYTALAALAHEQADTLLTPINDSFVDLEVLARVDGRSNEIEEFSHYALAVKQVREDREKESGAILDWVVVRNRLAQISSRNERQIDVCLKDLSRQLGFRVAHGIGERVIFREYYQNGQTALDNFKSEQKNHKLSTSHMAARQEVRRLIEALHLPIDDVGRKRAAIRQSWPVRKRAKVQVPDIFAD